MKLRMIFYSALILMLLMPIFFVNNNPVGSSRVAEYEIHSDINFNSLAVSEPVVANISMNLEVELNSSFSRMLIAHDASNNLIVIIATKDTIMAVQGASWKYELKFEDGTFDSYNGMGCGDIDSDGADEVIVVSEGKYMYAINAEDGSELFVRSIGISTSFNNISIADVVGLPGKEIILYSEDSSKIYIYSNNGYYLGSIDLPTINDVEYITSGDINDTYVGDELCILGYSSSSGYYYFMALNLLSYPSSYVTVISPTSLGTNFISGIDPSGVFGMMYIVNITGEVGNEIVFLGAIRIFTSSVRLVVFNSSGMMSSYWPSGISVGSSRYWAYAYFYDYNGDSQKEIIIVSKKLFSLVRNSTFYSTLYYPSNIELWGGTVYFNSDISNVSALMVYHNTSSLTTYAGIVNITNVYNFDVLNSEKLYSVYGAQCYTGFSDTKYYAYSYGRVFYGSASGSTLSSVQIKYVYTDQYLIFTSSLPNYEFDLIAYSGGWAKVYASDGTVLSKYLSPKEKFMGGIPSYGDYLQGTSGYELMLIECYSVTDGHLDIYAKIVSGTSVSKEINITLPQYSLYGVYIATPIPGSSKALIILQNYTSGNYNLGIIDINSGTITVGVELSNVNLYVYKVRIGGTYYYVVYYGSKLYLVDPSTAYIVGIKDMLYTIKYITVEDIDNDGSDEMVVKCFDGGSYYLYLIEDDMSTTLIYSEDYISDPIVIDISSESGKEIMFSYGSWSYYLQIYSPSEDSVIMDKYVGGMIFYPIMAMPPITVADDIVFCMYDSSNNRIKVARLLGSEGYTDMEIDLSRAATYNSYAYYQTIVQQEQTGGLMVAVFKTDDDRYAIFTVSYEVDYETPKMRFSCPYITSTNITGYIAWNTTLPITINVSDDYMLSSLGVQASYYDKYSNLIDQDSFSWKLESKSEEKNVTLYAPDDVAYIILQLTLRDYVDREKTIEETITVDKEAPTIWPQVPSAMDIVKDMELQISAYVGDDVLLKSVYVQFEGQIIPMKTTEEATPQPYEMYYYTAKVYVKRFNGEKKMYIIAEDYVGRIAKYEITLKCQIPLTEQPLFLVGIGVGVIAAIIVVIFLLSKKFGMFRKSSE